jgi:hypothetical protein
MNILLTVGAELQSNIKFTLSLPETIESGTYITNIIATDINTKLTNIVTVKTDVGTLGFFANTINKFVSNLIIGGIQIPYIIIFLGVGLLIFAIFFLIFNKKTWRTSVSLIIAFVAATLSLIIL